MDAFATEEFILPAQVITIEENVSIGPDELRKHSIAQQQALVPKTENSANDK